MNWWEKEPLRIIEICNAFDLQKLPIEEEVKAVKKLGGNVQHFHCMDSAGGLDDLRLFFETSVARKKNPDRLKEYLPLAHKEGIRVVVYFNVHWYSRNFGKEHPDWLQIRENGAPVDDVYTTGTSFCINSPYREWVFQILRDLCKYDIDGIFYDGPIFFANTCYCGSCRKLFKEKYGEEIPPKSNRLHPLWKKLIEFQSDSLQRFLSDSEIIIKGANPDILFYMNGNSNWPYWPTGRDNHKIIKHTDILGAEGGFIYRDLNQTPIYKPGITARILNNQAEGKPTVVFDCAGHKPWSWYLLPGTEISILLAETIANGSNYWLAIFPDDLSQPELEVVTSYGDFIRKNPEPFYQTKSIARIALLWPSRSAEFYSGSSIPLTDFTREIKAEGIGDITQEFEGFYEGLVRSQVPFDVIDEENLKNLSQYQLLILPNAACLSQEDINNISEFVANGGNIVASFESSLYNEYGERQDDFQLNNVFGIKFTGNIFGPMDWDYLSYSTELNSLFLDNITKKYIPAPTYGIKIKTTTSQILLNFCEKLKGCYEHTPEISMQPFMVINQYGKGKSIYLAGTFGITFRNFRFPEYLTLIKNFSNQLSSTLVAIENAPWVEINLRKKRNKLFLHLINHTSGLKRPLTFLHPLTNLKINIFEVSIKEAKSLRTGKRLPLKISKQKTSIILPSLEDYEVIEIKK